MATTQTKDCTTDMFKQATESFNQTMATGVKFQQDTMGFWNDNVSRAFDGFQSGFDKTVEEAIPAVKKNLDKFHQSFDQQANKSMDMLRQTFESTQKLVNPDQSKNVFEQTMNMWRTSFDTMRSNVDMITRTNTEMFQKFSGVVSGACCDTGKTNGKSAGK
jgi:phage-related protein